jgi:hypothetical protein
MNVSKGVGYGIRFDTQNASGRFAAVWSDTDALNHRLGTGSLKNVQAKMIQVTLANTNKTIDNLSGNCLRGALPQRRTHRLYFAAGALRVS